MAEVVRDLPEMLLDFDCPECAGTEFSGDRELVEMRRWHDTGGDGGEWVHYFACEANHHDLTTALAAANGRAVAREDARRGRYGGPVDADG